MTLSAMQKAMSSQLRKRLGLTGKKLTNPSVIKILTPHLEDKLAICNKGNAVYLFRGTNLAEVVLCFIRGKAGKSGPQLFNGMPFIKKDELIRILNNLLESGQVTLKLAAEFAPRFFASGAMGPVMKDVVAVIGSALAASALGFALVVVAITNSPVFVAVTAAILALGTGVIRLGVVATAPVLRSLLEGPQRGE